MMRGARIHAGSHQKGRRALGQRRDRVLPGGELGGKIGHPAHPGLSGPRPQQDGGDVVRLLAAGFERAHLRQQLKQERLGVQIALRHQIRNPGFAEQLARRVHGFGDAVGHDQELVCRSEVHGRGFVNGVLHQPARQPARGIEPLDRAARSPASNLSLSLARAEAVRALLKKRGVDPDLLAVRGAGPLEPLEADSSETARAAPRG